MNGSVEHVLSFEGKTVELLSAVELDELSELIKIISVLHAFFR